MSYVTPAKPRGRKARQRAIGRNITTLIPTPGVMCANIEAHYRAALEHGARSWYAQAHELATDLSIEYGTTKRQVLGILAALSPSTAWERNIRLAESMLTSNDAPHAYGDAIDKARAINNGADPYATLGGRKVRSFYRNLSHPKRHGAVTIDRHALSIALSRYVSAEEAKAYTQAWNEETNRPTRRTRTLTEAELSVLDRPGVYQMVAACYRTVARRNGIPALDLQSITWDYWRDVHAFDTDTTTEKF